MADVVTIVSHLLMAALPATRAEIPEEWAEGWHTGGDEGEVVLDATMFTVSDWTSLADIQTHNNVTTRYWAMVASVVPRAWTPKAIRMAHAADALFE